jgi:hypothetical protein
LFRISCERIIAHTYTLEELDSSYDNCGTIFCDRPEADVARGCPECLVTTLTTELKEDCQIAFANLAATREYSTTDPWRWTFDKLQQDVSIISNVDASVGGEGYSPDWTVRTKTLVSILRDERYKAQRARMKEIMESGRRRADTE